MRDSGDFLVVDKVNRVTGVITTTAALSGISGLGTTDYVFARGDENAKKIQGLKAWIPIDEPASNDNFLGVNRSADPTRLAGWRLDEAGNGVYENLLKLGQLIVTDGGDPDIALMHPLKFGELVKEIGPNVQYDDGGDARIGKRGIKVWLAGGEVTVFPDPDCPYDLCWILTSASWTLHHLKEFPHIIKTDGNESLRQSAADGTEFRMRYWANSATVAPGHNGVCRL